MAPLDFTVLGIPEIRHRDQLLKFPTRKAQALLIYLLIEGGVHRRAALASLFWPDSSSANARAALRVTLAQLRELLAEDADPIPHLTIEHDALGFNFASAFTSDAHRLLQSYHPIKSADTLTAATRQPVVDLLHKAVIAYRGDFLQNFSLSDAPQFDDWATVQRETCHRQMDALLDFLTGFHLSNGETAEAIDLAARWVSHSELNETASQRLIQARFVSGDRVGALQAYETYRELLQHELGIPPNPETTALAERIRLTVPQRRVVTPTTEHSPSAPMLLEAAMVGRADEFGKLIEVYATACQHQVKVVVLQGEAGAGKTRLTDEFGRWAVAQGADLLDGRAFEAESHLPYQVLVDVFRKRVAAVNAPEDLLSDIWLAELSRLLPELRERYPDLPAPTSDESTARTRLFEAIAVLGLALAERAPTVLVVDDLQWADSATLDVLYYVARRWQVNEARIMLLLNLRSESLGASTALLTWLADLGRTVPVVSLSLGALTPEDVLQLVQTLSADGEDGKAASVSELRPFCEWLFTETNGQPFYLIETLKALLERGTLSLKPHRDGHWLFDFVRARDPAALRSLIPSGVRAVIRGRLNYLQPAAITLVAAGAVLGHGFRFDHLCRVGAVDEDTGLSALEQALTNRLLRETSNPGRPSTDSTYDFVHDKIRELVYGEMSEARRRVFHRRAFEILEGDRKAPAVLADHALAAGLTEPAFRYRLQAGDDALRLFAVSDAILHYEQARHLGQAPIKLPVSAEELHHLFTQLGRAYELNNQFDQARLLYQELLTFARQANLTALRVVALNRLATLAAQIAPDFPTAIRLLQESLQLAAFGDDKHLLAETEWTLAQVKFYAWIPHESLSHAERALALARQLNHTDLIARNLNLIAMTTIVLGDWQRSKAAASEAASLYLSIENRALEADSLSHVANAQFLASEFQDALASAQQMRQIGLEIQNTWTEALSDLILAAIYRDTGFYTEALDRARESVSLARTTQILIVLLLSHVVLGTVYRGLRQLDDACAVHLEILQIVGSTLPRYTELIASELSADYALAEDWESAYRFALQALTLRDYTFAPGAGLSRPYETEALLRGGKVQEVAEDLARFEKQTGYGPRLRVEYLRSMAVVARWENQLEQEIAYLEEAALVANRIGLAEEQWSIWAALGDSYRLTGNGQRADTAYAHAKEVIHTIAARIQDTQLRDKFLLSKSVARFIG